VKMATRARYGARLMFELALDHGKGLTLLRDVARREGLSEKYLSQIIIPLRVRGLVISGRGARGGYRLARPPDKITMKDIVEALDGELALTDRVRRPEVQERYPGWITQSVWDRLGRAMAETLSEITLQSLLDDYARRVGAPVAYDI